MLYVSHSLTSFVFLFKFRITFTERHQLASDGLGVAHRQGGARLSIIMALVSSFGSTFFVAGIFKFTQDLLNFAGPLLLKSVKKKFSSY